LREHLEGGQPLGIGEIERRDRQLLFPADPQRRAARGDHLQTVNGAEQRRDHLGGGEDLLEVVEDQQHGLAAKVLGHARERVLVPADLHAERVRDG